MRCFTCINNKQWRDSGVKKCFKGDGELKGGGLKVIWMWERGALVMGASEAHLCGKVRWYKPKVRFFYTMGFCSRFIRPIYPVRLSQIGRRRAFTLKYARMGTFYFASVDHRPSIARQSDDSRATISRWSDDRSPTNTGMSYLMRRNEYINNFSVRHIFCN